MGRLFGTDGIRGVANRELTPELAFRLGLAVAHTAWEAGDGARQQILIGKDTRLSGDLLEAALTAGILAAGVDVLAAGMLPTPAVAHLTRDCGAAAGAMISASHNPVEDNGIKFFSASGYKLPDAWEDRIQQLVEEGGEPIHRPTAAGLGRRRVLEDGAARYLEHLRGLVPVRLEGCRVAVDAACGAAAGLASRLLRDLGAQVIAIHDDPDGARINVACGSTDPAALQETVVREDAQLGLAFDGDADRCLAVDERGELVDGDHLLAILGLAMLRRGELAEGTVVATVMSNLGLYQVMAAHGGRVVTTRVGDRYVLEELSNGGYSLGGEQSGHLIFPRLSTTGDGILTALQLLRVWSEEGQPLSRLAAAMTVWPQVLVNVRVARRDGLLERERVREVVDRARTRLGDTGRVLVRPSGTEPVVRVMVEAPREADARDLAEEIAVAIAEEVV